MTVARRKGAAGKADRLCSQVVRLRGACQLCHSPRNLETAHIRSRRFVGDPDGIALRTNPANCWCLCSSCHRRTHDDPALFMLLVKQTIGEERYGEFVRASHASHRKWTDADWQTQVDLLEAQLRQAGSVDRGTF